MPYATVSFRMTLSDLAKYSMTRSIARPLCAIAELLVLVVTARGRTSRHVSKKNVTRVTCRPMTFFLRHDVRNSASREALVVTVSVVCSTIVSATFLQFFYYSFSLFVSYHVDVREREMWIMVLCLKPKC